MLAALLLLTFGVTAVLVREAWRAARAQRELAERFARDYASYATWSTARLAETNLYGALAGVLPEVGAAPRSSHSPPPPLATLLRSVAYVEECRCAPEIPADYYFRIDFERDSVSGANAASEPRRVHAWVPALVAAHAGRSTAYYAVTFARHGDSTHVVAYTLQWDRHGALRGGLGFVTDQRRYAGAIFPAILAKKDILPRTLTGGMPNDSLLVAAVIGPHGDEIFRSAGWRTGMPSDTATLATAYGGLILRVALRSEAAERLRVGAVSRSRVVLWSGMLALSGALVMFVLRSLRREHELARRRSEFTASVSHELRTPLARILLFGETLTLGRTRSESERSSAAEVIVREARRLIHLVENALHFSRGERQAVRLMREHVPLAPLVRDVLRSFLPLARDAGVTIDVRLDETVEAWIDRCALRQVLLNLLDNAIKYGPRGQHVMVSLTRAGHVARMAVEDEGPGVGGTDRERIWQPFVRGSSDAAESGGAAGSGIGLAVVRDLTIHFGGRAWVEPTRGTGARFIIELPATAADTIEARRVDAVDAVGASTWHGDGFRE